MGNQFFAIMISKTGYELYGSKALNASIFVLSNPERLRHALVGTVLNSAAFPLLGQSLQLGPVTLPNRLMMSAHGMGLADGHDTVSPRLHQYLVTRAEGGAGLIGMESAPVTGEIQNRSLRIRLYEDQVVEGLAALAQDVHGAGARLSITLWHGGHTESFMRGTYALSPSAIPNAAGEVPKVITAGEIDALIESYADAARRCAQAGLDAVEIQTATNYLLGSFLNPSLNHRTDKYGGSRENRVRIVVAIIAAIREAVGSQLAVGIRTSVSHGIPGAPEDYDEVESLACMRMLAQAGQIDWVHLMSGSGYSAGRSIPAMHEPRPQLDAVARRFKQVLPVPVINSGNVKSPDQAEALLESDAADVVAMARSWIADPQWGRKALGGRQQHIRPCISCNQGCVGFVWRGIPGTCVLNPRAGREIDLPAVPKRSDKKPLTVVGGGPGGMEAARLAAQAGYQVTLFERHGELGGDLRLAAMGPTRHRWRSAVEWWSQSLVDLGVDVRLNSPYRQSDQPDDQLTLWATGAAPGQTGVLRLRPFLRNGIPGSSGLTHGRDLMASGEPAGGTVLIADEEGGWPAVSLAEWLLTSGAAVTVVTTERSFGEAQLSVTFDLKPATTRLGELGARIVTERHVKRFTDQSAILSDGQELGPFDHMILSTGTVAEITSSNKLYVGDCVAPRGVWAATSDAARIIRRLQ